MSSMVSNLQFKTALGGVLGALMLVTPSAAQMQTGEAGESGADMVARQPAAIESAINRWETLQKNTQLGFFDYSGFALAYPDFPRMEIIRLRAEKTLAIEAPPQADLIRFFDMHPPLTNPARARYAVALAGARREEAFDTARAAWRGGAMASDIELTLNGLYGRRFTTDDHVARMDALLWQGESDAAARHMVELPAPAQKLAQARLALVGGNLPQDVSLDVPPGAFADAGYLYNLVRYYRRTGNYGEAVTLLASRTGVNAPAFDGEAMVGEMLAIAKRASALDAMRIASRIDDLFQPDEDISEGSFKLRDQYTDLMWLGGTKALWELGRGDQAAPLFERYGKAARSSLTRSKGFFWAGRAARSAGNEDEAERLFEAAAQYPEYYYGQLALAALGRPMPEFAALPRPELTAEQRAQFEARPLARALIAMAANRRDWRTERRFFEALGEQAATRDEMIMAHDLAARLDMPEMQVVLGFKAGESGLDGLERVGFPVRETPFVLDWTMVHAISRQESEFDRTRISHAGARGIMQLMPGTAREQAGKLGKRYMRANLIEEPLYNIELGDAYFQRMLRYYDGAFPLAIGAYNAGPGRVNQWLRLNGDPRKGEIDWVTWVERIPSNFETRYYIMRVIGNAVSYSHMYPEKAGLPRPVASFLRQPPAPQS